MNQTIIKIDYEEMISSMKKWYDKFDDNAKRHLESLYLKGLGLSKKDGTVLWEDDSIVGFRPNKPGEYVSFTISIGEQDIN